MAMTIRVIVNVRERYFRWIDNSITLAHTLIINAMELAQL